MTVMPHDPELYFLGPLPLAARPTTKTASTATEPPAVAVEAPPLPEPTRWTYAGRRRLVVNPNECEICNRPRHANTRHHQFEPAVESEAQARLLGWPLPQES